MSQSSSAGEPGRGEDAQARSSASSSTRRLATPVSGSV